MFHPPLICSKKSITPNSTLLKSKNQNLQKPIMQKVKRKVKILSFLQANRLWETYQMYQHAIGNVFQRLFLIQHYSQLQK